ncbi:3-ketoacyl-CoA synthase 1-like [Nymphaea colorata]|nr:3-ketoacyl-CoA synthase 1-like [Nymphaea colorata]
MRKLASIQVLQTSFASLLVLSLFLHALSSSTLVHYMLDQHRHVSWAVLWCTFLALFLYIRSRPLRVFMVDYSCFKPDFDQKASFEVCEYILSRSDRVTPASDQFMKGIYRKSGLGDETYLPPYILNNDDTTNRHAAALEELEQGMYGAVSDLLAKTGVSASDIDHVIVTCGVMSPSPSPTSMIVNRFGLKESVRTFNLSGMGCGSGVMAVDLAGRLLRRERKPSYALVVVTESISLNWYFGDNRSMLVTNCIFRQGAAAALMTNQRTGSVKLELVRWLRTHHGADDRSYRAAFQEEDEQGTAGFALTKDLIRVAGEGLRAHIRTLAPRVLPYSQLLAYSYASLKSRLLGADAAKPQVPDFTTAFEHICVHTGGKAVIENISRVLKLGDHVTEPSRMTLHRFGNTSSSLVFYEYAYFEAKQRVKKGDKVWMLAFGTGFKVGSLVWKAMRDSSPDSTNPWADCIHRYPLKAW